MDKASNFGTFIPEEQFYVTHCIGG